MRKTSTHNPSATKRNNRPERGASSLRQRESYTSNGITTTVKYVYDGVGRLVSVWDGFTSTTTNYTYDAWGKRIHISGSMARTLGVLNPLRYRGYVYDSETGYYYLQSRYYDPEIGRFINADTFVATGQGMLGNNMFAYCNNNPVIFKDTSGHALKPCTEIINDGAGGDYGPIGTIGSDYYAQMDIYNKDGYWAESPIQIPTIDEITKTDGYKVVSGVKTVYSAKKFISNGAQMLFVPVPTIAEDVIGVGLVTYGIIKGTWGIATIMIGLWG